MTINYENRTIEMTKTEAKEAGKYNSDNYNELKEIRKDFPDFRIVTKSSSRKRDTYKGLTYAYMLNYITKHAKEDDVRMKEFDRLRGSCLTSLKLKNITTKQKNLEKKLKKKMKIKKLLNYKIQQKLER